MKNHAIKNITEILENSSLIKIVQRANQLNELNEKIQSLLPAQFRKLYRIVNLVENQLIISPQIDECVFKINPDFKSS